MVGPVDVGHRDRQLLAEHEASRHVLGHLVHRARREHAAGAQGLDESRQGQLPSQVVDVGVAGVDADGLPTVRVDDCAEPTVDLGEGLVPGHRDVSAVRLAQERPGQPVRIVMQVGQGHALRAQVPAAEHVLLVAGHLRDAPVRQLQRQPAGRLAQGADAQMGGGVGHGRLRGRLQPPG